MTSLHDTTRLRAEFIDPFDNRILLGYFEDVFRWYGFVRFFGLPSFQDNSSVPIAALFVEPNLSKTYIRAQQQDVAGDVARLSHDVITYDKMVILGDPGTGKSTALSWIAWQLASAFPGELAPLAGYVPVPVVLRELDLVDVGDADSLIKSVLKHPTFARLREGALLSELISRGQVLFLLDGLDEVPVPLRRQVVDGTREAIHVTCARCRWVVTSRIVGYDDYAIDTTSPPNEHGSTEQLPVERWNVERRYIAPLSDQQVQAFASRWFQLQDGPSGQSHAREFVHAVAAQPQTQQLVRLPSLLTLTALIFRVHARLPHGRALLFDKIADAYLETIDAFKRIDVGPLTLSEKKQVMAFVAFQMQSSRGEGSAAIREILVDGTRLRNLVSECIGPEKAVDFVSYLSSRSGVMQQRGPDQYAFAHLLFQDYFGALYLANHITTPRWLRGVFEVIGTSVEDLKSYFGNTDWRELLILFFEILASRPGWSEEVLCALFGEDIDLSNSASAAAIAAIATDPYSALPDTIRTKAIKSVWRAEILEQQRDPNFFKNENRDVINVFRGVDESAATLVWEAFGLIVRQLQPSRLKLIGCLVSADRWASVLPTSVASLKANGSLLDTLEPLSGLVNLLTLDVSRTNVSDVRAATALRSLRSLRIGYTRVADVLPLLELPDLRVLYIEHTDVAVAQLAHFKRLESLAVDGLPVTDLDFLAGWQNFEELYASDTLLANLDPLRRCLRLQTLAIDYTRVNTLEPLRDLTNLRFLVIDGTGVTSLDPLRNLGALETLSLAETRVRDIRPLAKLSALRRLSLFKTEIESLAPLLKLRNLEELWLPEGTPSSFRERLRARFPAIRIY
jgi:internalin A